MIAVGLRTTSVILGKTRASLYRVCRSTTGFHRPLTDLLDVVHRHTLLPVIPETKQAAPEAAEQLASIRATPGVKVKVPGASKTVGRRHPRPAGPLETRKAGNVGGNGPKF